MFPATVREVSRLNCWNTMPMRVRSGRSFASERWETCWPSTVTVPDVGFSSPLIMRIRVDLPAPEKPMTPKTSPRFTASETSSTAFTPAPFLAA